MLLQLLSIALLGAASLDLANALPAGRLNDGSATPVNIKDLLDKIKEQLQNNASSVVLAPDHTTHDFSHFSRVTATYRPRASTAQPESADDAEFVSVSTVPPEEDDDDVTSNPESASSSQPEINTTPEPGTTGATSAPEHETTVESGSDETEPTEEPETGDTAVPETETSGPEVEPETTKPEPQPEPEVESSTESGTEVITDQPDDETTEGSVINVSVVIGATDATTQHTPGPEANPETEEPETETVTDSGTTEAPESEITSAPEDDTTVEPETDVSGAPEDPKTEEPETGTVTDSVPNDTTAPPESTSEPEVGPETEEPKTDVTDGPEEPETEEPEGESTTESGPDATEEPAIELTTEPEVEQPETTVEPETEEPETETTTDLTIPAEESRIAGIPRSAAPEEAWEDLHRRIDPTSPYNLYNEKYYAIIEQWAEDWNITEHDEEVRDYIWTRYRIQNEVATRVIEALDGLKDYFGEYAKLAEQQDYEAETSDTYFGPSTYLNEYERPIADAILRHFTDLALRAHGIE